VRLFPTLQCLQALAIFCAELAGWQVESRIIPSRIPGPRLVLALQRRASGVFAVEAGGVFMRSGRCGSLSSWALCCLFAWVGCSPSAER